MKTSQTEQHSNLLIASLWRRFIAKLIDGVIITLILSIFTFQYNELGINPGYGYFAIIILILWLYNAPFEGGKAGATIGKRLLKIRVVNIEYNRINYSIATLRFFTNFIFGFIIIGWLMAFFNEKKQGLHDIIAGTIVVKK